MRRRALDAVGAVDPAFHLLLDHQLWISLPCTGEILHVDETWAAARYQSGARTGREPGIRAEAFQILEWEAGQPELAPTLKSVRASGLGLGPSTRRPIPGRWGTALACPQSMAARFGIHPPTALARLNLLASALLRLLGLGACGRPSCDEERHRRPALNRLFVPGVTIDASDV